MDIYTSAVNQLKKAITSAIEKAIENGVLPKAEIPLFIIETPARSEERRVGKECG